MIAPATPEVDYERVERFGCIYSKLLDLGLEASAKARVEAFSHVYL